MRQREIRKMADAVDGASTINTTIEENDDDDDDDDDGVDGFDVRGKGIPQKANATYYLRTIFSFLAPITKIFFQTLFEALMSELN